MRLFFVLWCAASVASACSCIQPGLAGEINESSLVFRGVAKSVNQLPARPEMRRFRYSVTFSVSEYWKGDLGRHVTIYYLDPGADCLGAHFDAHTEYVVFAKQEKAADYKIGDNFWYGWVDLMPAGMKMLTVSNYCNGTAPVKKAVSTIIELGRGNKPGD